MAIASLIDLMHDAPENRERRWRRWPANVALALINAGVASLIPVSSVIAAEWAGAADLGLLNQVALPFGLELATSAALLSLAQYWLHRFHHEIPWLWRVHSVHHSDHFPDSTTAFRHHPVEVLVTSCVLAIVVVVAGIPAIAVLALAFVDALFAIATHTSGRLPRRLEVLANLAFVTPALHEVHHSDDPRETNSNYGTTFSIWDRAWGTFLASPLRDRAAFRTGLTYVPERDARDLDALLTLPLRTVPRATSAVEECQENQSPSAS